jgi:RND family efflux transporter MFP subunit
MASLKLDTAQAQQDVASQNRNLQLQIAELGVEVKQADLASAQAHLNDVSTNANTNGAAIDREQRLADVLRSEADEARAAAQPTLVLHAPFDGVVTALTVGVGQNVQPRTTILRYADPQRLSVTATAAETEVSQLSAGQSVTVSVPGLNNKQLQGTIVDVGDVGLTDNASQQTQYPVRVDLGSALEGLNLKIGMSSTVSLNLRQANDVLHVPTSAMRRVNGKTLVSRVGADGQLSDVEIQVGETYGSDVEVLGGLQAGDTVAVIASSTVARSS